MPLGEIIAWVDEEIRRQERPPDWVLDLSLAATPDSAIGSLWRGWASKQAGLASPDLEGWCQCVLGFYYLRFEGGEIGMGELLQRAGDFSDAYDCGIDCEEYYYLLNEIDGGGPTVPSKRPLAERVMELFVPFAAQAREGLGRLPRAPR